MALPAKGSRAPTPLGVIILRACIAAGLVSALVLALFVIDLRLQTSNLLTWIEGNQTSGFFVFVAFYAIATGELNLAVWTLCIMHGATCLTPLSAFIQAPYLQPKRRNLTSVSSLARWQCCCCRVWCCRWVLAPCSACSWACWPSGLAPQSAKRSRFCWAGRHLALTRCHTRELRCCSQRCDTESAPWLCRFLFRDLVSHFTHKYDWWQALELAIESEGWKVN